MIKLTFDQPKNGWLPTKFNFNELTLEFDASRIPENPTNGLCTTLILALSGLESESDWNLEPVRYVLRLKPDRAEFLVTISKIDEMNNRKIISEFLGNFESVILPLYRGLKKLNSMKFNPTDWNVIDQTKLEKLNILVEERKGKTA